MTARWIRLLDHARLGAPPPSGGREHPGGTRTDYQRDYDRIVFSTAFRRLHDKTQVFPLPENDLVHSRLTHSLEVSCVGRSLGAMVGQTLTQRHPELLERGLDARAFGDIVAAACLAHDLGNPPFGHAGEDAIGAWFREHPQVTKDLSRAEREDLERFEGNAQGFRIVTRLQMPERPGLQLTMATLAAFGKYPRTSGPRPAGRGAGAKKHGVFQSELSHLVSVAEAVGLEAWSEKVSDDLEIMGWQRHPLAFLMEAADDICYSILDIEDGFRLGHVAYQEAADRLGALVAADPSYTPRTPNGRTEEKETIAYLRAKAINQLARQVCEAFVDAEETLLEGKMQAPLADQVPSAADLKDVTRFTLETCYRARDVVEIELAGYEVLSALLEDFVPAVLEKKSLRQRKLLDLLPDPIPEDATPYERILRVTDHLSGMTDRYAISTFRKLRGITLSRG